MTKKRLAFNNINQTSSSIWNDSWDGIRHESQWLRHLYLIRHGQYFDHAINEKDKKLTSLGKEQLEYTGERLKQMNIKFDRLIHSGMVRAFESASIINQQFDHQFELIEDQNLAEGLPVAPIPYAGISQHDVDAYGHKLRIDKAFETYFHRARNDQYKETHDIIVFHANVLRYFICKLKSLIATDRGVVPTGKLASPIVLLISSSSITVTVLSPEFATTISRLPSWLKSVTTTACGFTPAGKSIHPEMSFMLPNRTVTVLLPEFATIPSNLSSRLKSPIATEIDRESTKK
ncbi:unnamed protein product, partial [Rotaria sp. Silwood2]